MYALGCDHTDAHCHFELKQSTLGQSKCPTHLESLSAVYTRLEFNSKGGNVALWVSIPLCIALNAAHTTLYRGLNHDPRTYHQATPTTLTNTVFILSCLECFLLACGTIWMVASDNSSPFSCRLSSCSSSSSASCLFLPLRGVMLDASCFRRIFWNSS